SLVHDLLLLIHPNIYSLANDTATTKIYTLSLHDALPISDHPPPATGWRRPGRRRKRPRGAPLPATAFDRVPDQHRNVGAAEALDLADAGGGGDVDLGEIVADDVDADEDHVPRLEGRGDGGADLALARRQRRQFGPPADMQVGARLALGRDAVEPGHRLAVDVDDPLVALPD